MEIVVFAEQFRSGIWELWQHACSSREAKAVADSALARARARSLSRKPNHDDFLAAARSAFDVGRDSAAGPGDGDIRVYCVCVDRIVMGDCDKIRQYSPRIAESRQFADVAFERIA